MMRNPDRDQLLRERARRYGVAVPPILAARPLRSFRAADAAGIYRNPSSALARLARRGAIHRLATGIYCCVPPEHIGSFWMPSLEAAAAGIAAVLFGADRYALMGVSAARLHGAIPRAIAIAHVASPLAHRPVQLTDRNAHVQFVARDLSSVDIVAIPTDLGLASTTGIDQTITDLRHYPSGCLGTEQRDDAVRALLASGDQVLLS
jgi:predicted transcriptional regulator of viral defense system